jgi:hypothetical protein
LARHAIGALSRRAYDGNRAVRIGDHLSGDRTQQPPFENRIPAMSDNDVVDLMSFGIEQYLLRGMPDGDLEECLDGLIRDTRFQGSQQMRAVPTTLLDDRLGLDLGALVRWPGNSENVQFCTIAASQIDGEIECPARRN